MADITLQTTGETRVTCVPNRFIDEYMKDANGEFVKVYLYLLRCLSAGIDVSIPEIADRLESTSSDIIRALNYWANRHLLSMTKDGDTILTISLTDPSLIPPRASAQPAAVAAPYARIPAYMSYSSDLTALMPVIPLTAAQAAALSVEQMRQTPIDDPQPQASSQKPVRKAPGSEPLLQPDADASSEEEDPDFSELLFVTERYFGHPLSHGDMQTLSYWYHELSLSSDLISYLEEYCIGHNHTSIHYMNRVALDWSDHGITTRSEAAAYLQPHSDLYRIILREFGLSGRSLTPTELAFADKWSEEYDMTADLIGEACKRTMLSIHKPEFRYADSILSKWHRAGVTSLSEVEKIDQDRKKTKTVSGSSSHTGKSGARGAHNFEERSYTDFDQIERQLIANKKN